MFYGLSPFGGNSIFYQFSNIGALVLHMPTRAADLQQIQDSIAKLTTAFTEFCATQDQRDEINVLSVQALQT